MFRLLVLLLPLVLAACVTDSGSTASAVRVLPGQASITISRPNTDLYMATPASVELNGTKIASLVAGETYSGGVAPGPAVVKVSTWLSPGESSYRFTVEPGKNYRLRVSARTENLVASMAGGLIGQAIEGGGAFQVTPAN